MYSSHRQTAIPPISTAEHRVSSAVNFASPSRGSLPRWAAGATKQAADPELSPTLRDVRPVHWRSIASFCLPSPVPSTAVEKRPISPRYNISRSFIAIADAGIGSSTSLTTIHHSRSGSGLVARFAGYGLPSFGTPRVSSGNTTGLRHSLR